MGLLPPKWIDGMTLMRKKEFLLWQMRLKI